MEQRIASKGASDMGTMSEFPGFNSYAVCVGILAIKMLVSATYTGVQRQRNKGYINPEDARVFGQGVDAVASEHPAVAHALRIQRNDGENIPIFFALGLVYVLSGASASGAAIYCWTFTLARLGHTVAYTLQLQPWRALLYLVGTLTLLGMAVQVIF
jgi:uncharacterized MAPEG superfamily protein